MTGDAVYLDFAATTPMDPRVADAMLECAGADGTFANPSSVHIAGRRAAAVVEEARAALASLMRTEPGRLTWTSGATESDNLAIRGAALARAHRGKHLISMPTEHKAVSETFRALEKEGFELTWLAPDSGGLLSLEALSRALRDDTQLVSVMHVNNETGVIQDICAIGELCREHDVLFHTDAAQSVGKLDIDLGAMPVDLVSLTGHKFYAPKGIGALYIAARPGLRIFPILYGGGQEKRLRPGTLPVHQIAGLGKAAAIAARERQANYRHVSAMRDRLWHGIADLRFDSLVAGNDRFAVAQPDRCEDVPPLAVLIFQERDVAGAVRFVLDADHLGGDIQLGALEVDEAVTLLVPTASVLGGDDAVVVTPAFFGFRPQQ